ncbi:hypothetical protein J6590_023040 [Homalodisca vitripennis]|nr:hypothetical protein J6590_023040 [Homalodisca vitripennis]
MFLEREDGGEGVTEGERGGRASGEEVERGVRGRGGEKDRGGMPALFPKKKHCREKDRQGGRSYFPVSSFGRGDHESHNHAESDQHTLLHRRYEEREGHMQCSILLDSKKRAFILCFECTIQFHIFCERTLFLITTGPMKRKNGFPVPNLSRRNSTDN